MCVPAPASITAATSFGRGHEPQAEDSEVIKKIIFRKPHKQTLRKLVIRLSDQGVRLEP